MLENILFETHFSIIPFPIYVVDVGSCEIIFTNNAFRTLYGAPKDAPCYRALYGRDKPCLHCKVKQLITVEGKPNGQTLIFENYNDVDDHWYQMQEKAISWPDGRTAKYSIAVDITDLKTTQNRLAEAHAELALKNKELELISSTDKLTGIYNRLKLDELFSQELARTARHERPLSLLILDLDHFKSVNDTYGHLAGDKVLVATARLLAANTRANDIPGRWGGEEFMLVCPETDGAHGAIMAEKLRKQMSEHQLPSVERLTLSIGIASYRPGDTEKDMVLRADAALYRAKELGRNRVEVSI